MHHSYLIRGADAMCRVLSKLEPSSRTSRACVGASLLVTAGKVVCDAQAAS